MPANLTPQYFAAEEAFRLAKTREEKIAALEEMLAIIPKHKGTDHLQGDIKRRIAKLREEDAKGGPKAADPFLIPKEGAGQVVLLGSANTGKSALVGALTRAKVHVAEYPFTTPLPVTGMIPYEDIHIQLVDLPPVADGEIPKGMAGTLRLADLILVLADLGSDDCLDQLQECLDLLRSRRILETPGEPPGFQMKMLEDILFVAAKRDKEGAGERLDLLREVIPPGLDMAEVSIHDPAGLRSLAQTIFKKLGISRVYSKIPGKDPDMTNPFVLKRGETVLDMAALVHRDFPDRLKYARVWGSAKFPGQSVEREYRLADKDIVELHLS